MQLSEREALLKTIDQHGCELHKRARPASWNTHLPERSGQPVRVSGKRFLVANAKPALPQGRAEVSGQLDVYLIQALCIVRPPACRGKHS